MPSSGCQKSALDRKSTRLNSSHGSISYAVFCLKQKTDGPFRPEEDHARTKLPSMRQQPRSPRCLSAPPTPPPAPLRFGLLWVLCFFFFNDTATTEIYTLSLHDALPISSVSGATTGRRPRWWRTPRARP